MDTDQSQLFEDPNRGRLPGDLPELELLTTADGVPERFGEYEVDRVIARGTHGIVFKATDTHGLQVAVKWLRKRQDDSELDSLIRLSKTVSGLPPILSSGTKGDRTYFVMPYYERRSLRFRLRKQPFPQPLDETIRIARAFTEVLGELHRHGYTHADFKPDNVLLESMPAASDHSQHSLLRDDERLVLSDFGTIRSTDGALQFGEGTMGYAAPELMTTIVEHDPRVDIYAASATLIECITGVLPEQVREPTDSAFDDTTLRATGPLESALRKGLSFEPNYRQATISEWFDTILTAAEDVASLTTEFDEPAISTTPMLRLPDQVGNPPKPTDGDDKTSPRSTNNQGPSIRKSIIAAAALIPLGLMAYWAVTQWPAAPSLASQPGATVDTADEMSSGADPVSDTGLVSDLPDTDEADPASPALLETTPDARWGTPRRRLTTLHSEPNLPGRSDGPLHPAIGDTSRSIVSENGRWILTRTEGDWTVVDRSNGNHQIVNLATYSQPVWHPTEPETIIHLDAGELAVLSTTVDGKTTVAADLAERIKAELPDAVYLMAPSHGEPSANGWRFAWAVANDERQPIGFITYDLSSDSIMGLKVGIPEGDDLGGFGSIAMSKMGTKVVVAYRRAFVIYDKDFTNERRILQAPSSYELVLASQEQDVLVVPNYDSDTFGEGWIVAHNLDTGEPKRLLNLRNGSGSDVQISSSATDKPGWVLVSTHNCSGEDSWSCDRVIALNVDDATTIDLAETNSCANDRKTTPFGVVNRDFTKAWFNTDFGSCGEDGTIVELTIDAQKISK